MQGSGEVRGYGGGEPSRVGHRRQEEKEVQRRGCESCEVRSTGAPPGGDSEGGVEAQVKLSGGDAGGRT